MSKIYSIDVTIAATVYIRADTRAAAIEQARALEEGKCIEVGESEDGDIPVSGLRYDDPDLPDLSLSPGMTVTGLWGDPEQDLEECD